MSVEEVGVDVRDQPRRQARAARSRHVENGDSPMLVCVESVAAIVVASAVAL